MPCGHARTRASPLTMAAPGCLAAAGAVTHQLDQLRPWQGSATLGLPLWGCHFGAATWDVGCTVACTSSKAHWAQASRSSGTASCSLRCCSRP
eukprot:365847-Chlamydomonas_euryale.AAC.11